MRIWKYPLGVTDIQALQLPRGARFLTVQAQAGEPCLWALVDESETNVEIRRIAVYGTGHVMPAAFGEYIATFQTRGGALVFHAFELK